MPFAPRDALPRRAAGTASGEARHLIVPFAASFGTDGAEAMRGLALPRLERLLARLEAVETFGSDEWSLSPPHEVAIGRSHGWQAADGLWPFAALQAAADGLSPVPKDGGWALLTPVHWHVAPDAATLLDPAELDLDEATSRAFFDAARPWLESEGWRLSWGAPTRWYAAHPSFAALPSPSLDRVIGRNVDPWLPATRPMQLLRRLQSEVQMVLHTHALNDAREARGAPAVNSFWLSGCGAPAASANDASVRIDDRLRAAALRGDRAAWADAWRSLDAGPVAEWLTMAGDGEAVSLTLCGERHGRRYERRAGGLWRRLAGGRSADAARELAAL